MAISVYVVRPDRVTATGVITPYPVRQRNPVMIARQTINPFIRGIRNGGPAAGLSGPPIKLSQTRQTARIIKRGSPFAGPVGAAQRAAAATARGTIWDMIKMRRYHELAPLLPPGHRWRR